jgi:hypothetical protein
VNHKILLFAITLSLWPNSLLASATQKSGWISVVQCTGVLDQFGVFIKNEDDLRSVEQALNKEIASLPTPDWQGSYCSALSENLKDKANSLAEGALFSSETLIETTVHYEAFRIKNFNDAGVSPKRFFGYLDEQGKSITQEKSLKVISTKIALLLNAYGASNGIRTTVTPKEIIVTHLAEGGAKLLTTDFANVEKVHPVYGVGLDDFRIGFNQFPGLLAEVDSAFGSHLAQIGNDTSNTMRMSFDESILGTAVMYFYEKDLAEQKLAAENRPLLETLPLDEQFVTTSLVYNSGILFAPERIKMILNFQAADYLFDVSEKTAMRPKDPRARLPVLDAAANDALLKSGGTLPQQLTSWNAIYHILQRYGAWVALTKFSNYFDEHGNIKS